MNDTDKVFEIPLYACEMLEDRTYDAFNAFIEAGHKTKDGHTIIGLFVEAAIDQDEPIQPLNMIGLWVRREDDVVMSQNARDLPEEAQSDFDRAAGAWVTDDLVQQSFTYHPFDTKDEELLARFKGRLLRYHHFKHLSALLQEYIPTFLEDDNNTPLGLGQPMADRTCLGSLIMPPAESNHEKLHRQRDAETAFPLLELVWSNQCEDHDIALIKPDFSKPVEIGT
jgi:hypothetical protein